VVYRRWWGEEELRVFEKVKREKEGEGGQRNAAI
jgi:hypothetical protein